MNIKEAIDCIQDLIDVCNFRGTAYVHKHNGGNKELENVLDCLKNSEPVKHAKWIDSPNISECVVCSYCMSDNLNEQLIAPATYKYCPVCGAKMDLEDETC